MGSPLFQMHDSALNDAARQAAYDSLENGNGGNHSPSLTRRSTGADSLDSASSPFINNVDGDSATSQSSNQENVSPSKDKRRSRIMSGSEMSPLKMLAARSNSDAAAPAPESQSLDDKLAPPAPKSPRKSISPMRRFPVRTNTGDAPSGRFNRPQSIPAAVKERDEEVAEGANEAPTERPRSHPQATEITLEEAIAQNPGVKHAIEIFEDTLDSIGGSDDDDTNLPEEATPRAPTGEYETGRGGGDQDEAAGDETMMSEFSDFSAIPSMTTFARLGGRTPTQMAQDARSGSSTTNLLDFTDNLRFPGRHQSPSRSMTVSDAAKTPQRQSIANLLDFEIPPMPTPRSVPTISARELESLKSNFMSEISNLRATLSGKEAEATSLRTALIDAEKRVGQSMEQLREERSLREQNAEEKDTWEKRGREMETVLRQVKDEIMTTQRERETLESRLEESEGRREAAEMMAQEAESKMAAMRASRVSGGEAANSPRSPKNTTSQREIELAVEKVARELHSAYKSKHEAKVAALKKNYEVRWDKKIRELETKIEELTKENEELRVGRDATLTKVEFEASERSAQAVKDSAQIKELQAEVEKLEAVLKTVRSDNDELRHQLEGERVEKGELVTLAEELMQMQSNQSVVVQNNEPAPRQQQVEHTTPPKRVAQRASAPVPPRGQTGMGVSRSTTTTTPRKTAPSPSGIPGTKSGMRNSMIGRPPGVSGLKAPGSIAGGSRIGGGAAAHSRAGSSVPASGLARPASSLARPGGLMSSIQQMGSYRGRGE
ncbi:hypothetical protein N0V82_002862 [Gnomoniopsis sp. IMI 355080]|nr:hypothetical protein N0V82_002862 [Gnomoniopsis sp. IMI 355080]